MKKGGTIRICALAGAALLAACDGPQSALVGAGPEAARVLTLTWILFAGAAIIFLGVMGAAAAALFGPLALRRRLAGRGLVVGAGLVFPSVALAALLVYGFAVLRAGFDPPAEGEPVRIVATGEQWWWRVVYETGDGPVETANFLAVPVGRPIEVALETADVIHSFWIPAYAGKVDMIPGRTNALRFAAFEPGLVRGQCAEYCGGAHALMAFHVEAMEPDAFEAWLALQRADAQVPADESAARGRDLFIAHGCGACHAVRGEPAEGVIGPDLTHVGGRPFIAAAALANTKENLSVWVRENQHAKPQNLMPEFAHLSDADAAAIADYLTGLK